MKNFIETTPFITSIKEMRKIMIENLIDIMKQYGVNEVYCWLDDTPLINCDITGDVATLDCIEVAGDDIIFCGSNEYNNGTINAKHIDIEYLVEIHNWVMDYEDELFKQDY